jgi:hypothetical protein
MRTSNPADISPQHRGGGGRYPETRLPQRPVTKSRESRACAGSEIFPMSTKRKASEAAPSPAKRAAVAPVAEPAPAEYVGVIESLRKGRLTVGTAAWRHASSFDLAPVPFRVLQKGKIRAWFDEMEPTGAAEPVAKKATKAKAAPKVCCLCERLSNGAARLMYCLSGYHALACVCARRCACVCMCM